MSEIVIKVENLCKQYRYGVLSHRTLHKDLQSWWARVRGKPDPNSRIGDEQSAKRKATNSMPSAPGSKQSSDDAMPSGGDAMPSAPCAMQSVGGAMPDDDRFYALQDINFEVKQGEILGIIGKNGAGKSTLLKILSKVTTPTRGQIKIKGRVASLLEVGTGFHPELTGRENIFLNGAILGMNKAEIKRKFDEIVAFAEVEKFLDTPVKRYSSGMYVRLAFAVAAHLEPEILLVDEVLAVGDAAFQKKCLGKMGDVAKEGRTVLFVSHNMGTVKRLCHRVILLQEGRIADQGVTEVVTRKYLESVIPRNSGSEFRLAERPDLTFQILGVTVTDEQGNPIAAVGIWERVFIRVDFLVRRELFGSNLAISVSCDGNTIFNSFDTDLSPKYFERREAGYYRALVPLPVGLLTTGTYTVSAGAGNMISGAAGGDIQRDVVSFDVVADGEDIAHKSYSRSAMVIARLPWEIEKERDSHE